MFVTVPDAVASGVPVIELDAVASGVPMIVPDAVASGVRVTEPVSADENLSVTVVVDDGAGILESDTDEVLVTISVAVFDAHV